MKLSSIIAIKPDYYWFREPISSGDFLTTIVRITCTFNDEDLAQVPVERCQLVWLGNEETSNLNQLKTSRSDIELFEVPPPF